MDDGSLRIICGPTAAGKSALVMALAAEWPLSVISADSRQIYRGFDIGTAKPGAADRAAVPHEGLDVVDPTERFSAAQWVERARGWVDAARAARRAPVIVGGTGFYIRAFTNPLFDEPPLDPARRASLAAELQELDTAELRRRCERLDPVRAHLGRVQLLRAIEVALLTGTPISEWHARAGRAGPRRARYLLVDPRAALREAIVARAAVMMAAGWEGEVAALMRTVPDAAPAWNATGYGVIRDVVRGRLSHRVAAERIVIATRQYAKRQRTWFRHQLAAAQVTLIDPRASDAIDRARSWWHAPGGTSE